MKVRCTGSFILQNASPIVSAQRNFGALAAQAQHMASEVNTESDKRFVARALYGKMQVNAFALQFGSCFWCPRSYAGCGGEFGLPLDIHECFMH